MKNIKYQEYLMQMKNKDEIIVYKHDKEYTFNDIHNAILFLRRL